MFYGPYNRPSRQPPPIESDMGYGFLLLSYAGYANKPGYARLIRTEDRSTVATFERPMIGKIRNPSDEKLIPEAIEILMAMEKDLAARGLPGLPKKGDDA